MSNTEAMVLDDQAADRIAARYGFVRRSSVTVPLDGAERQIAGLFGQYETDRSEGAVLCFVDRDGVAHMAKYKTRYYRAAKRLRTLLTRCMRGNVLTSQQLASSTPLDRALYLMVEDRNMADMARSYAVTGITGQPVIDLVALLRDHPDIGRALAVIAIQLCPDTAITED